MKIVFSGRRPCWAPLLSAAKTNVRLQWAQAHQKWPAEDWENVVWSDEAQLLLRNTDGEARILHWLYESTDPTCLMSKV